MQGSAFLKASYKAEIMICFLPYLHRNLHTNGIDDLLLFVACSPDEVDNNHVYFFNVQNI